MGPIASFSGLASGIQWRDMVQEIMAIERARKVAPLTQQVDTQRKRLDGWRQLQTHVAKLATAAKALRDGPAFDAYRATTTQTAAGRVLVGATASSAAAPGTYTIEVLGLARAEKLGSTGHVSTTDALGLSGSMDAEGAALPLSFSINGRTVEIEPNATLNQVRDAINGANTGSEPSGVGATILTTAAGEHRLVLTADTTGAGGIRLVDGEDGALAQLGLAATSRSVALPGAITGDPVPSLATVLGLSAPPTVRTIVIDGHEVQVDLTTDTLPSLLDKVRAAAAASGADPLTAARIVEETNGQGQTVHRLEVGGSVVGKADDAATQAILTALGFTREGEIVAGRDALLAIDGFMMTRRSNSVGDALQGVTINLLQAEIGSPVELRVTRDTDRTVDAVKALVTAYNELVGFVRGATAADGALAGNSSAKAALSSITNAFLTDLQGVDGESFHFARATLVGVSLGRSGSLEIDETRLRAAIGTNPEDVRRLFAGFEGGTPGLAGRVATLGELITRSGNGLVAGQTESLQRSIEALSQRMDAAESRLEVRQEAMIRQFTRMEEALSRIQAQSSWLTAQLQALQPRERR